MGSVQQLDAAGGFGGIDLVQTELAIENVDRTIGLPACLPAQMRGTVDEYAGAVERGADATITIEVALGHGTNTTR